MKREELSKKADDIVFRCFAQGQYWGTGSGEEGILNDDYLPEQPIDRAEAVAALMAAVDQYTDQQRLDELKRAKLQGYIAGNLVHKVNRRIATIQANITNKGDKQ